MSDARKELENVFKDRVGDVLPNALRLGRMAGVGAMAAVYCLESPKSRPLARKILHAHLAREPMICERFRREAYAAKVTAHPGVVHVRGDGVFGSGQPDIVMDRVMGETLEEVLSRPPGAIDTAKQLITMAPSMLRRSPRAPR